MRSIVTGRHSISSEPASSVPSLVRIGSRLIGIGLLLLSAACARPTPPVLPTAIIETLAVTRLPTLPPTWTPAPTLTTAPTDTPFPTVTSAPTLTADQICQQFRLIAKPAANASIAYDGQAGFTWLGLPADATLTLQVTIHGEKAGLRADITTPGEGTLAVPMLQLPQEGSYDWRLWLQVAAHPEYGPLCEYTGTLVRQPLVIM